MVGISRSYGGGSATGNGKNFLYTYYKYFAPLELSLAAIPPKTAGNGGGNCRLCLELGRNRRFVALILWRLWLRFSLADMTRTVTDQIRGGVMWFSILLAGFCLLLTLVIAGGRIDSADEFLMALRQDRLSAIPLAFSVFLFVVTLPRPSISKRAVLAVVIGCICWILVWRFLVDRNYAQLEQKGVDPDAIIHAAKLN